MPNASVFGQRHLKGEVNIQGSKASAQRILPATAALPGKYLIRNMPFILDMLHLMEILKFLGADIEFLDKNTVIIDTSQLRPKEILSDLSLKTNGSFLFAGALLCRFGNVKIGKPGGDHLGKRAINWHLDAFRQLGATVINNHTYYHIILPKPNECFVRLPKPTYNGSVNTILASLHASGTVTIDNIATEPEIDDLNHFLNLAGAQIERKSPNRISVHGIKYGSGQAEMELMPDHVDAATFAIAGILCKGPVKLNKIRLTHMDPLISIMTKVGAKVEAISSDKFDCLIVECERLAPIELYIQSGRFPKPSTDYGPMIQVLMTQISATSIFHETIFEQRFFHVPELVKMGADITSVETENNGSYFFRHRKKLGVFHGVQIKGPSRLHGTNVQAHDIRAGAALVLAGLVAEGETMINGYEEISRGYEDLDKRLRNLGARIVANYPIQDHTNIGE